MSILRRILLVEDSDRDAELTLAALEQNKLANEVVVAHDGAEALDYLTGRGAFSNQPNPPPAVVFLDLKMPGIDGLEVLRQIRSAPSLKHLPVVMLTSSREEQDLLQSYKLGINAYVVKPIGFDQFMQAVRQLGFFWALLNEPPPDCGERTSDASASQSQVSKAA